MALAHAGRSKLDPPRKNKPTGYCVKSSEPTKCDIWTVTGLFETRIPEGNTFLKVLQCRSCQPIRTLQRVRPFSPPTPRSTECGDFQDTFMPVPCQTPHGQKLVIRPLKSLSHTHLVRNRARKCKLGWLRMHHLMDDESLVLDKFSPSCWMYRLHQGPTVLKCPKEYKPFQRIKRRVVLPDRSTRPIDGSPRPTDRPPFGVGNPSEDEPSPTSLLITSPPHGQVTLK